MFENREYFSFRVNINKFIAEADIVSFFNRYPNALVCREDADEEVKNTHCHCLIWGSGMPTDVEMWREIACKAMNCAGTGRHAICDNDKPFDNAVRYVCKGHKETPPTIIVNTTPLTQAEILDAWARYWHDKIVLVKKKHEDTSMRLMDRLWKDNQEEFVELCTVAKNRYDIFKFWHAKVLDIYVKELKTYDDDKFMAHVNGLMLQSDPESFRACRWSKHCKMAGFSNAAVEHYESVDEKL